MEVFVDIEGVFVWISFHKHCDHRYRKLWRNRYKKRVPPVRRTRMEDVDASYKKRIGVRPGDTWDYTIVWWARGEKDEFRRNWSLITIRTPPSVDLHDAGRSLSQQKMKYSSKSSEFSTFSSNQVSELHDVIESARQDWRSPTWFLNPLHFDKTDGQWTQN